MASAEVTVNEYRPKIQTRVRSTSVQRARFPVIDAHNHFSDSYEVPKVLEVMDACNIKAFVDLSGGHGEHLKRRVETLRGKYPDRFVVFFTPDFSLSGQTNFGELAAQQLVEAVESGASGLKIYKELGLRHRDENGKLFHVDDDKLSPLWQTAGELGVPVLIHVADPPAFFEPLDHKNERYTELQQHPTWHFYGEEFPPFQQLIAERNNLVERHPKTTFICAHVGSQSEDLASAAALLDRYPNLYFDFSARIDELGRKPRQCREFFIRYQDCILFGTDQEPTADMYCTYFRFMETDDECFEYVGWPRKGFWHISALDLPDDVQKKIYHENASGLIPGL